MITFEPFGEFRRLYCTNPHCRETHTFLGDEHVPPYCPACGAQMREAPEEKPLDDIAKRP